MKEARKWDIPDLSSVLAGRLTGLTTYMVLFNKTIFHLID